MPTLGQALVLNAFQMAIWQRRPASGGDILLRSRWSYYSEAFQRMPKNHGMVCGMNRKGHCWECAACPWGTAVFRKTSLV
jgi:transposase InsO family protein